MDKYREPCSEEEYSGDTEEEEDMDDEDYGGVRGKAGQSLNNRDEEEEEEEEEEDDDDEEDETVDEFEVEDGENMDEFEEDERNTQGFEEEGRNMEGFEEGENMQQYEDGQGFNDEQNMQEFEGQNMQGFNDGQNMQEYGDGQNMQEFDGQNIQGYGDGQNMQQYGDGENMQGYGDEQNMQEFDGQNVQGYRDGQNMQGYGGGEEQENGEGNVNYYGEQGEQHSEVNSGNAAEENAESTKTGDQNEGADTETSSALYGQSLQDHIPASAVPSQTEGDQSDAMQRKMDSFSCPVCQVDFAFIRDLRQHLATAGCQSLDIEAYFCSHCSISFEDVHKFKTHYMTHLEKFDFSCHACGTRFTGKRALDRHMLVDASILNKLRASQEGIALPTLLCRTVVDILAESIKTAKNSRKRSRSNSQKQEKDIEKETEKEEKPKKDRKGRKKADKSEAVEELENKEEAADEMKLSPKKKPASKEVDVKEEEPKKSQKKPVKSAAVSDDPIVLDDLPSPPPLNVTEGRKGAGAPKPSQGNGLDQKQDSVKREEGSNPVTTKPELEEQGPLVGEQSTVMLNALTCPMCGDLLSDKQKLTLHIAEHEKLFPYFCTLCEANFSADYMLESHVTACHIDLMWSAEDSETLQCRLCGMYFPQPEALALHLESCRQAPSCVVCGDTFETGPLLQQHYYEHSEEERASAQFLPCNDCGEVFVSTIQLRQHQRSHGTFKPYSCEECGDTFKEKRVLERHRQLHYRVQDLRCDICGVQLLTRSGYMAHLRGHKNNSGVDSQIADKLMAMAKETTKRNQANRFKTFAATGEKRKVKRAVRRDPALFNMKFEVQPTPQPTSTKKSKKDAEFFNNRDHACPFCDKNFKGADNFQEHVANAHEDQAFFDECDICRRKFYGKEYLQRHRSTHNKIHMESYPCDQCSKVFRRKFSLETHKKVHSFKKFLPCDICGEQFRFINEVEKHKHKVHRYDRIQNLFECNICKVKFATMSYLNIHCRHTHKPEDGKPFKCAKCNAVFGTCTELKQHIFTSHQGSPGAQKSIKQEPADTYGDNATGSGGGKSGLYSQVEAAVKDFVKALDETEDTASVKSQFKVEDMTMGVDTYNHLTLQKMSHITMVKKYECETCEKCFATRSDLRTHIRTHTGETPYKCDYCDRAFKQRGHRKLHIQVTHTKDMPYTCELCHQGYPTRYRYLIHLKRHSGIKEHKCPYCDRAYYTFGKLNEHKRKNHPDEMASEEG